MCFRISIFISRLIQTNICSSIWPTTAPFSSLTRTKGARARRQRFGSLADDRAQWFSTCGKPQVRWVVFSLNPNAFTPAVPARPPPAARAGRPRRGECAPCRGALSAPGPRPGGEPPPPHPSLGGAPGPVRWERKPRARRGPSRRSTLSLWSGVSRPGRPRRLACGRRPI